MANPPCENADANDILERPVASLHHDTNIVYILHNVCEEVIIIGTKVGPH
jgi:hypothetical protein